MRTASLDIVVTGLAAVSAAGVGLEPLALAVQEGKNCLRPLSGGDAGGATWGIAHDFRAGDFMPPLKARKFDRCSLMAVATAGMALRDAGIDPRTGNAERIGIVLGCGFGGIANSAEFLAGYFSAGVEGLAPMLFPNTVANAAASNASIEQGFKGPNITIVQRFSSAETALEIACRFLQEGRADVMITGGVDELTPLMIEGFRATGQLKRFASGFGEGCGLLVLERRDDAVARGAAVKGSIDDVRSLGLLLPGEEEAGLARLFPQEISPCTISLSGTADLCPPLVQRLPASGRIELHRITGRSLAMGGLALVALFLTLREGEEGLHLAASPEGPYVAIRVRGGFPV